MSTSTAIPDMYDRLQLLQQYRHVAIVGVSADPYLPSHFVAIYLQAEGYDIIPINPNYAGQTLLGKRVYATLTEAKAAGEQIVYVDVLVLQAYASLIRIQGACGGAVFTKCSRLRIFGHPSMRCVVAAS